MTHPGDFIIARYHELCYEHRQTTADKSVGIRATSRSWARLEITVDQELVRELELDQVSDLPLRVLTALRAIADSHRAHSPSWHPCEICDVQTKVEELDGDGWCSDCREGRTLAK